MSNPYDPYSSGQQPQQPQQPADAAAPTQFVPLQQPQQPAYGAPQGAPQDAQGWSQPGGQAPYGAPQQQPYGAPQQPQQPYGAPQQPYGAPQQPQVPAFGAPPQQPGQPAFGQPAFGQGPQGPYGYPTPVSAVKANRTGGAKIAAAIFGTIVGRVVVLLVVAACVAGYHFATANPAKRDNNGQVNKAGTLSVLDLKVGDCFDLPSSESDVTSVTAIPCTEAHDAQIYAEPKITESSFPGTDTLESEGKTTCESDEATASLASDLPDSITAEYYFPENSETFDDGTDYFSCALTSSSKDLTKSYVTAS
ncbi:hypothetical protein [Actinospica robiniae]|uniref:hypothetical protein n=1 Tax=Actinospica robiniae TaxID=304901 RepID=UPI0004190105|nr:hypothetical protein [Actinospica robiniae]